MHPLFAHSIRAAHDCKLINSLRLQFERRTNKKLDFYDFNVIHRPLDSAEELTVIGKLYVTVWRWNNKLRYTRM